jgi:hypothetical protein
MSPILNTNISHVSVLVVSFLLQLGGDTMQLTDAGPCCLQHTYPESLLLWQHQS